MKSITKIIHLLRKEVGKTTAVVYSRNPFIVLIATVISQRTKDINTERAAKRLFSRYKTPRQIAKAPIKSIEKLIYGSGFYKVKAKRIKQLAKIIFERYKGKVPADFNELIKLPGVGRKTANCVLVYAYQLPAIPVDTHVHRISNRIGVVKTKTPEQTETALSKVVPKRYWIELNELMVKFGQRKCLPRNPRCDICLLNKACDYGKKQISKG
jgi:endonuclease-3